ncbi:UNVERIFIED_CONTAM: hypothetical protein Sindi_2155400 [Sesamum indicum]
MADLLLAEQVQIVLQGRLLHYDSWIQGCSCFSSLSAAAAAVMLETSQVATLEKIDLAIYFCASEEALEMADPICWQNLLTHSYDKLPEGEAQHVGELRKNEKLCTLCEEFATEALNYLSENKTQTEIIGILHKSCSRIPSFKQQCIVLVDYYAPLFFLEVSSIQAEDFCRKVDLCEEGVSISQELSKDKCDICHNAVTEALLKLKDPDTELEIVQLLLKACNSIGKNVQKVSVTEKELLGQFKEYSIVMTVIHLELHSTQRICLLTQPELVLDKMDVHCNLPRFPLRSSLGHQYQQQSRSDFKTRTSSCTPHGKRYLDEACKRLVFEYAPVIIVNAEQFLETNDICAILHACDSAAAGMNEALVGSESSMHAAS